MPFIEVRAGGAELRVVRIDDFRKPSVRAIVDGMTVGVGEASIQMAEVPADSNLERVVRTTGRCSNCG